MAIITGTTSGSGIGNGTVTTSEVEFVGGVVSGNAVGEAAGSATVDGKIITFAMKQYYAEGQPYICPACYELTNGTWGGHKFCFECYKDKVQAGEISLERVMPYPINWGRVIAK